MSKFSIKNNINSELTIAHRDDAPAKTLYTDELAKAVVTIDDMMNIDTPNDGDVCIVKDMDRGGNFIYDSIKASDNDGGVTFNGWVRQYSGAVNVKWFGAMPNNINFDNSSIFKKVFESFYDIFIPNGNYNIDKEILIEKNGNLANYYSLTNAPFGENTLAIKGENVEQTIISTTVDTMPTGSSLLRIDGNPTNTSSFDMLLELNIENLTIRGSGRNVSTNKAIELKGIWKGYFKQVKLMYAYDGMYISGNAITDDGDAIFNIIFDKCTFLSNGRNGISATSSRPSFLNFNVCDFRNNKMWGYEGGGVGLKFNDTSFAHNGETALSGGLHIKRPNSGSLPRGLNVIGCTFEDSYDSDIWLEYLQGGSIQGNIFTPIAITGQNSIIGKSCIKIFDSSYTNSVKGVIRGLSIRDNQVQNWQNPDNVKLYFIYTMSNFGTIENVEDFNNNFLDYNTTNSISTLVNNFQWRYFNQLKDQAKWNVNSERTMMLIDDSSTITIDSISLLTSDSRFTNIANIVEDNQISYDSGGFVIRENGIYDVSFSLKLGNITSDNTELELRITLLGITKLWKIFTLVADSTQTYTVSGKVYLLKDSSLIGQIITRGATTNAPELYRDGTFIMSAKRI